MAPPETAQQGVPATQNSHLAALAGGKECDLQGDPAAGAVNGLTLSLRTRAPVAIALAVAGVALIAWLVTARPDAAALRGLPADQRAALTERTVANLREVCQGPERPRDFCREQAELVLRLPECSGACRAQARNELLADTAVR